MLYKYWPIRSKSSYEPRQAAHTYTRGLSLKSVQQRDAQGARARPEDQWEDTHYRVFPQSTLLRLRSHCCDSMV